MKVVAYMFTLIGEIIGVLLWSVCTDGLFSFIGSVVIGLAFGALLARIANYREVF